MAIRTRIAPTPSGYLHLGNAWSFVLTWLLAKSKGGSIHLRIDDLDTARLRPEYLEDIFASLEWLGLDWDTGPRNPADFLAHHSQRLRLDRYRAALDKLAAARDAQGPLVYACTCSREQIKKAAVVPGIYPGTCRAKGLALDTPGAALRLRVGEGVAMGDFVLRQKNGDPAYQVASVVDDQDLGINLVVRGRDLMPSTGAQLAIAGLLDVPSFLNADIIHHGLIVRGTESEDGKLSKSAMGTGLDESALPSLRARLGSPAEIYAFFATCLGMERPNAAKAADLLEGFAPECIPVRPLRWEDFPPH